MVGMVLFTAHLSGKMAHCFLHVTFEFHALGQGVGVCGWGGLGIFCFDLARISLSSALLNHS